MEKDNKKLALRPRLPKRTKFVTDGYGFVFSRSKMISFVLSPLTKYIHLPKLYFKYGNSNYPLELYALLPITHYA